MPSVAFARKKTAIAASTTTLVCRTRERPATQIAAGPQTQSVRSHGSAMATSGRLTTMSANGDWKKNMYQDRCSWS